MAYVPSHQELRDHPKVKRLARILDTSIPATIGHLHGLWWWAMDYAPDGDVSRFDEYDLADAGMWEGDPGVFVKALQKCGPGGSAGFLDDTMLHDWWEYGGKLVAKREADRERKARSRAGTSDGGHIGQSGGRPRDVRVTAQVEKRRGEESREGHGGDADAPTAVEVEQLTAGPLPDKPVKPWTYSRTLGTWAEANGQPCPTTATSRTAKADWLLQVLGKHLPVDTDRDRQKARGRARDVIADYLVDVTGQPMPDECWSLLGRNIADDGSQAVLRSIAIACESGAGLSPPHSDNPLSLLLYANKVRKGDT